MTSTLYSIDVRRLHHEDLLRPGLAYGWQWADEAGSPTSKIGIRTLGRGLSFAYAINGEQVEQRVSLRVTPCNYGGSRSWLECPGCRRRVAILYLSRWVACCHCFRLAYPSQSDGPIDRLWRRQGKIEAKLSSGKRMMRATRQRLADNLVRIAEARNLALIEATCRLLGRQPPRTLSMSLRKP